MKLEVNIYFETSIRKLQKSFNNFFPNIFLELLEII